MGDVALEEVKEVLELAKVTSMKLEPLNLALDSQVHLRGASLELYSYADTELVGDDALEKVEQVPEMDEDAGINLEPFNLARERQDGI